MTATTKSIAEVLKPRAKFIAQMIAERADKESLWTGYKVDEELDGELRDDGRGGVFATYWRKGAPQAIINFDGITLKDVQDITVGHPDVIRGDVEERFEGKIEVAEGATYSQKITHTFSKTTSLSEAVKIGAEASVKATLGAEYAGVSGSLELAAKITAAYEKNWGKSETVSDTIDQTINVDKPGVYEYEAVRSLDNVQRKITATTSFSHGIYFLDERSIDGSGRPDVPRFLGLEWKSLEEFISVAEGIATSDKTLYYQFVANKPSAEDIEKIRNSGRGEVSYISEYDNIKHQDITIKKKGEDNG